MKPKIYIDGQAGTTGLQIYDRLGPRADIDLLTIDPDKRKDREERKKLLNAADLVFLCLPDDAAREAVALIENENTRVIDCSTAHRTAPGWVYGLPELQGQRELIRTAKRVANPGCYATGAITLLRPLTQSGLLSPGASVCLHALSGYTGAGNKAIAQYESPERDAALDSPRHYALGLSHKHIPEIMAYGGLTHKPLFLPMICDFPQGMVVALPLELSPLGLTLPALRECYRRYYQNEPLITLRPETEPQDGFLPANTLAGKDTLRLYVTGSDTQAVAFSQLDNLGKGASGAAVQNMDIMLGFHELEGLNI